MRYLVAVRRLSAAVVNLFRGVWTVHTAFARLDQAGRDAAIAHWSREVLRAFAVELRVGGEPAVGAVLMVANHVSWLDICTIHAVCGRTRFVSKLAVSAWPILGRLVRAGGTLFIERERRRDALRVLHEISRALQQGDAVGVFPEGTTGSGHEMLPFHANLLQAAINAGAPVQPIVLRYSEPGHAVSTAVGYTGDTSLLRSAINLAAAQGVVAHVQFLPPLIAVGTDRRALAARLYALMTAEMRAARGDEVV